MYYSKIKKLLFPLVIVLVFILFPANNIFADTIDSGKCGDNITWTLSDNGTLEISGSGQMYDYNISNQGVTDPTPWYSERELITRVLISDDVTRIGSCSFYGCSNLAYVSIPDSITDIGVCAFYECTSLTEISLPSKINIIDNYFFYGCTNLKSVTIPESVSYIGDRSFYGCTSLDNVVIPDNVTWIGYYAFAYCSNLKTITLPENITRIGNYAFSGCSSLTKAIIQSNITVIGNYTFNECTNLESVDISDSVTSIGTGAFFACQKLKTVSFPDGFKSIGSGAFQACYALESVSFPDSLTTIGDQAFCGCESLKSIDLPDSLTSIGRYAFSGCTKITSVDIPSSTTTLGEYIFCECPNLSNVVLPDNLTTISNGMFFKCSSLISIDIPDSVTVIGHSAFSLCTGLTDITIPDGVDSISDGMFYGCTGLIRLTIPDSITSIGDSAFYDCKNLKEITIPETVTYIGIAAFRNCSSLESITIPNGITTIYKDTFRYCSSLKSIYIPDGVTTIAEYSFQRSAVSDLEIPDSVTSIGDYAFAGCKNLKSLKISKNITTIPQGCFQDCVTLTEVNIPYGITEISSYGFSYCTKLAHVELPQSLTTIGMGAFNVTAITEIQLPDSLTSIDESAFAECTKLEKIIIPYGVTFVGSRAFANCHNLSSIVMDKGLYSDNIFRLLPDNAVFHFYYNVNYTSNGFGTVSAKTRSYGTDIVELNITPQDKYQVGKVVMISADNSEINVNPDSTGKYICTMPDSDQDVTVRVTFVRDFAITSQPSNYEGAIGDTAKFSVKAEGEGLNYQWQVYKSGTWKNTSLTGNRTSTLEVGVIESRDGMKFRCVVKDAVGNTIISDAAKIIVMTIEIAAQPNDYAGPIGDNAKFTIAAAGNNLKYQWQVFKNGVWKNTSLSGNKTATLEVAIMESRDGMKFRCVVTDVNGKSLYSDEATLTVAVPAVTITSEPEDCSGPVGDTAVFTVIAEGEELTYQWQVYKSGAWKNTSLTGNKTSTLEVGILDSRNGMKFRCIVKDANGNTATSNEAVLTVTAKAVSITSEPEDYSGPVGDIATFEIEAEGENLSYQWQVYKNGAWKNTSLSGNTTSSLDVEITEARDGMTFRCVVTDGNGKKATSDEIKIIVAADCPVLIVSYPESYSGSVGDTAMFEVVAEGENLTYQWQVYKNGAWKNTSLAGNNTSLLAVEVTTARNGMTFRCVVTNDSGFSVVTDEVKVLVV